MSVREVTIRSIAVVVTILAVLILWQMSVAVVILFAAFAIGACMYPLIEHLQERGWPRSVAIGLTVAGSLTLVIGFFGAFAVPIVADLQEIGGDTTQTIEELIQRNPDHWFSKAFTAREPDATAEEEASDVPPIMTAGLRSVVGTGLELTQLGAHIAICIALSVYWTIDRQRIERLWMSLVPVKRRNAAQKMVQSVERELGAYLRSELAQGMLAALFLWAGFAFLDMRYAALAAVIAAILMMIPWLGNLFAVLAVLALSSGKLFDMDQPWLSIHGGMAAALVAIVAAFLHFVIEPRLFNDDRFNSFWTVLITLALTFAFGIWGLIFGPAVGFGIQIAVRHLHSLLFYEPTRVRSMQSITEELALIRQRYPHDEAPVEVNSLLDRLEALISTHKVAELN